MLLTKRAHHCTIFQTLSALMKVHPINYAIFETTRSGFVQILHHCSVPWKITPLYFFSSNLIYFRHKLTIEMKLLDFWVVASKFTKFLMSFLEARISFSSKFASLFSVMKHNPFLTFHLNIYMVWTKGSNQSANFETFNCSHKG